MEVKFYDFIEDSLIKFVVIVSRFNGKWVLCKHKERNTYEVPGGKREKMKLSGRRQSVNYMRKQGQLIII